MRLLDHAKADSAAGHSVQDRGIYELRRPPGPTSAVRDC